MCFNTNIFDTTHSLSIHTHSHLMKGLCLSSPWIFLSNNCFCSRSIFYKGRTPFFQKCPRIIRFYSASEKKNCSKLHVRKSSRLKIWSCRSWILQVCFGWAASIFPWVGSATTFLSRHLVRDEWHIVVSKAETTDATPKFAQFGKLTSRLAFDFFSFPWVSL